MQNTGSFIARSLLVLGCLAISSVGVSAAEETVAPSEKDISRWIDGLSAQEFSVREWSSKQLLSGGADVIYPLSTQIPKIDVEAGIRGLAVLKELALLETEASVHAEDALREIAANQATASSQRAEVVLRSLRAARALRAENVLRRLGARISNSATMQLSTRSQKLILLDENWTGTLDDLEFLSWFSDLRGIFVTLQGAQVTDEWMTRVARIPNLISLHIKRASVTNVGMAAIRDMAALQELKIYYCDVTDECLENLGSCSSLRIVSVFGGRITREAFDAASESNPDWISRHGRGGFLGIKGEAGVRNGLKGCVVGGVTPDQAAQKADIRSNDLIIEYDGQRVTEFLPNQQRMAQNMRPPVLPVPDPEEKRASLSQLIGKNERGQRVKIKLQRGRQTLTKEVVLGEWP